MEASRKRERTTRSVCPQFAGAVTLLIAGFVLAADHFRPGFASSVHAADFRHAVSTSSRQQPEFDLEMMELGRQIPGFGGAYISHRSVGTGRPNPRGPITVHVRLTGQGDSSQARAVANTYFSGLGYSVAEVQILPSAYTFLQLRQWRDALVPALRTAISGTLSLDADEAANRVTIGVETQAGVSTVAGLLGSAGVPAEAVNIVVRGPFVREQSTLQGQFRPVPGGVYITVIRSASDTAHCTLGVNANRDGAQRFYTASHCSGVRVAQDTFGFRQPNIGSPIGREYIDPPVQASTSQSTKRGRGFASLGSARHTLWAISSTRLAWMADGLTRTSVPRASANPTTLAPVRT